MSLTCPPHELIRSPGFFAVAEVAKAGGVECETVQVIHDHPYEAIVSAAKERGCDLIAMASQHRAGEVFTEFAAR